MRRGMGDQGFDESARHLEHYLFSRGVWLSGRPPESPPRLSWHPQSRCDHRCPLRSEGYVGASVAWRQGPLEYISGMWGSLVPRGRALPHLSTCTRGACILSRPLHCWCGLCRCFRGRPQTGVISSCPGATVASTASFHVRTVSSTRRPDLSDWGRAPGSKASRKSGNAPHPLSALWSGQSKTAPPCRRAYFSIADREISCFMVWGRVSSHFPRMIHRSQRQAGMVRSRGRGGGSHGERCLSARLESRSGRAATHGAESRWWASRCRGWEGACRHLPCVYGLGRGPVVAPQDGVCARRIRSAHSRAARGTECCHLGRGRGTVRGAVVPLVSRCLSRGKTRDWAPATAAVPEAVPRAVPPCEAVSCCPTPL